MTPTAKGIEIVHPIRKDELALKENLQASRRSCKRGRHGIFSASGCLHFCCQLPRWQVCSFERVEGDPGLVEVAALAAGGGVGDHDDTAGGDGIDPATGADAAVVDDAFGAEQVVIAE